MRRKAGERGFTLLETIIALVIASSALVVLTLTLSGAVRGTDRVGQRVEALSRARSRLAALLATPHPLPGQRDGADGDGFHWRTEVREVGRLDEGRGVALVLYAEDVAVMWGTGGRVQLTGRRLAEAAGP